MLHRIKLTLCQILENRLIFFFFFAFWVQNKVKTLLRCSSIFSRPSIESSTVDMFLRSSDSVEFHHKGKLFFSLVIVLETKKALLKTLLKCSSITSRQSIESSTVDMFSQFISEDPFILELFDSSWLPIVDMLFTLCLRIL